MNTPSYKEGMTLLCGEDGRWNPDPQGLCTGKEKIYNMNCNTNIFQFMLLCLSFHYNTSVCLP